MGIAPGANNLVITSGSVKRISARGTHAQVIASPFVHIAICRCGAEGRMVEVDAGVKDTNQDAFAPGSDIIGNGAAIPNGPRADPFRTSIGGVGVVLIFEDFADARQTLQFFRFLRAQFDRNTIKDHVIHIADFDRTTQQTFSLRQHRLAIDCKGIQVVLTFNAVHGCSAFGSSERGAFEQHDVA